MIHVNYNQSTIGQRAIAVFGNLIGGAVVVLLGILGAFFEYDSLVKEGFSLITIPLYAIVSLGAPHLGSRQIRRHHCRRRRTHRNDVLHHRAGHDDAKRQLPLAHQSRRHRV